MKELTYNQLSVNDQQRVLEYFTYKHLHNICEGSLRFETDYDLQAKIDNAIERSHNANCLYSLNELVMFICKKEIIDMAFSDAANHKYTINNGKLFLIQTIQTQIF